MLYEICRAKGARENKWVPHKYNLVELGENLFDYHRETDKKDGPAFMAGVMIGLTRKTAAVTALSLFIYDIDGAQSYDDVRKCITDAGLYAFLYTTYSHKTRTTLIKTDQYAKWAKKVGRPEKHDEEGMRLYLDAHKKGFLSVTKIHPKTIHTGEGICIQVDHAEIDKTRIVLPMAKPYVVHDESHGYKHADCIRHWKSTYCGIGKALGLDFDISCVDVTRLHYLPSHPPGAKEFKIEKIEGELIDYDKFSRVDIEEVKNGAGVESARGTVVDENTAIYENWNVGEWFYHHGKGAGEAIISLIPDEYVVSERGQDKLGFHITCPFEADHSTAGGQGTFIDPGEEGAYPKIHCCHAHCQGLKTEGFIAGMLEEGWFSRQDLVGAGQKSSQTSAFASVGLDPSTLASLYKPPVEDDVDVDIANIGPVTVDDEQRNVVTRLKDMASNARNHDPLPPGIAAMLDGATTGDEVRSAIAKAVEKGAVEDRALAIYCLATSGMSFKSVKMYYGSYASDLNINSVEFIETVKFVRTKVKPIDGAIVNLNAANVFNLNLSERIKSIAAYYDMTYGEIEKFFLHLRKETGSEAHAELDSRAAALSARYAKWKQPSATVLIDMPATLKEGKPQVFTIGSVFNADSNGALPIPTSKGGFKHVNVFDYWLKQYPAHTVFDKVLFDPTLKKTPPGVLNTFFGYNKVKPKTGDASPITNHILNVWCCGDVAVYNWLTTYLANIFQNPGKRYPTAVAIIGNQGSGKSLVFDKGLLPMVEPYGHMCSSRDEVSGRFNASVQNKIVFVAEEAIFHSDHATASKLKAWISAPTINVERKGFDVEVSNNYARFFFVSNEEHVLKLDPDDRRYLILQTSRDVVNDLDYFKKLSEWFDHGGREIWMNYLLTWNPEDHGLTWEKLQTAPKTDIKLRQIMHSLGPVDNFLRDLAIYGYVGGGIKDAQMPLGNISWALDGFTHVETRKFNDLYEAYLKEQASGGRSHVRSHLKTKADKMFGMGAINFNVPFRTADGIPMPHIRLPPRREALDALLRERYLSQDEYESTIKMGETL